MNRMYPRSILCTVALLSSACSENASLEKMATPSTSSKPGTAQAQREITCTSPAPAVFDHALCLCEDYRDVGQGLIVTSAHAAANVGVNGASNVVGETRIGGSWIAYGGLSGVGHVTVQDDLVSTKDVSGVGMLDVGRDLSVGGNLSSVAGLTVGGTLRLAGERRVIGVPTIAATGPYTAPAGPPCGCDPATYFDVAAAVSAAKTANDNAAAGLSTLDVVGEQDLALKSGKYYFENVRTIGQTTITIDGAVALFLDGSLESVGKQSFKINAGSTLDLYVSGNVGAVGQLDLGDEADPAALRIYVGGTGNIRLVGQQTISGLIYAPASQLGIVGQTKVNGALFGKSLNGVGQLSINYSSVTAPSDGDCQPEDSDGGTGSADDGGSDTGLE